METTTHRFVRPSHGGYVGHVTVKVLSQSRQWMQGSSITEYDSMAEAAAKQRRHDMITAPFDDEANVQCLNSEVPAEHIRGNTAILSTGEIVLRGTDGKDHE